MVASFAKKMMAAAFLAMHHALSSSTATGAEITEAPHQLLTPTLHAQELFHHVDNSWWNLELKAASEEVDRRRRLRQYRKQRKLRQEDDQQQQEREMQSSKNNCLSSLQRWFVSLIETIGMDTWEELNYYNVTSLTYLYKHHVSSSLGQNEYFGTYGESTTQLKETHESLKQFWTLGSSSNNNGYGDVSYAASPNLVGGPSNVVLLGMHGSDLSHKSKLVPTLQQLYMLDAPTAMTLADKIQSIIRKLPDSFNNPVLTANALAIQSPHSDGSNNERDSIIIGDGVFEFLDWLQLLDSGSGSNYIQAHEFAHHLQYDLGMMKKNSGLGLNSKAEETRRLELMADMFGSYYLAHSHGGHSIMMGNGDTTTNNVLNEVHRAAFSMGDCESGIATHHGSPRQRECASKYGANLAIKFGGGILSPVKLMNMFDSKLDDILDLTAEECRDESVFDSTFGGQASNNGGGAVVGASSSPGGTNNAGGYWWDKSPLEEAVEDLHIPTFGVAPPSADIDWSSWDSSSSTESWGSENSGWGGGATTFEWYPEEEDSSADNPPAKVGDDKFFSSNNDDWFGNSQWVAGSRATNSGISNGIHASLGAALLCLLGYIMM